MKKAFLLLLGILSFNLSNSQKLKKTDIYKMDMPLSLQSDMFKNTVEVTEGILRKDGTLVKIGDTLTIGESASKISNQYQTLTSGRVGGFSEPIYADLSFKGEKVVVERLRVRRALGQLYVLSNLLRLGVGQGAMVKYVGVLDMELSFNTGELIHPNKPLTREEAIAKLKEAKDLLDLDMMTLEEYNEIKKEVTPIIKGQ